MNGQDDCFEEMCSPKPLDLLQKLIAMVSPGNAEETGTVQQIENVIGSNLLNLLHVVSTHISYSRFRCTAQRSTCTGAKSRDRQCLV